MIPQAGRKAGTFTMHSRKELHKICSKDLRSWYVVYGPRQSGKTTMLHHLIDTLDIPSV